MNKTSFNSSLIALLMFSTVVSAVEFTTNENKDNSPGNNISNANLHGGIDGDTAPAVKKHHKMTLSQNIEDSRLQSLQLQLEAYERFLERKKRNSEVQSLHKNLQSEIFRKNMARQKEFINNVEQRRELIQKLMIEQRDAAQQRREKMLQKMHQTRSTSAFADDLS